MSISVDIRHGFGALSLDVQFEAPNGITALFGRSGVGKTSIVNAVAGVLRPDRGRIILGDHTVLDTEAGVDLPMHQRDVGYVFQDARLFPHMSVEKNLLYGRKVKKLPRDPDLMSQVVEMLEIGALLARRPGALSGGEKQRVGLGRALLSGPRVLLLDEPLAALDDARKAEILPFLERLRDEAQMPILYVSHSIAEVARLASTVVLLDQGHVALVGPTEQVLSDPAVVPLIGVRHAGAIVMARVTAHEEDGLSRLETGGGALWLPQVKAEIGSALRVRIRAQDVILSLKAPEEMSALNSLRGEVVTLREGDGPGVIVQLRCGDERVLARITRRSARVMKLQVGMKVFAIIKSVSVAHSDVGA